MLVTNELLIDLTVHGDERGSLISLEENKNVPFDIKRVYYIFDTKNGIRRGLHAHRNLKQIVVCVSGSCTFLLDEGDRRITINLDSPSKGLFIDKMVWREMYNFSDDCVLMVLANQHYNEEDYIRDYNDFLKGVRHA